MKKFGIVRIFLAVGITIIFGSSCNGLPGKVKALPVEQALLEYFKGGYVPYSLPGRGEIFRPGAIIRYEKGAEVLVWKREKCFDLDTTIGERVTPKVRGTRNTEINGALGLFFPKAAAAEISSELKRNKVEAVKLDFGTLFTRQIPEGSVEDQQGRSEFSKICKKQYGKGRILVLGTIGSKTVRYEFAESSDYEAGLKAATNIKMRGGVTVKGSEEFENTMEVVSDEIIWMGYIAYELKDEGLSGKGPGSEPELIIEKLPAAEALELKRKSK